MAKVNKTAPSEAHPNNWSNKPLTFRGDDCELVFIMGG
jgi:hypothetical protein